MSVAYKADEGPPSAPAASVAGDQALPTEAADMPDLEPARVRRRKALAWIALALVAASAAAAYWYATSGQPSPAYRLAPVTRGPVASAVTASGTINPVISVQVGSQVSGQIKQLLVDFNSEVRTGQLIARIDPDIFETQVEQAQADLAVARANVATQHAALLRAQADVESARANRVAAQAQTEKTRAALADAQRDYDRKRRLAESGAETAASRDTALAMRDQTRAQLGANEAQELSLAASIRAAEAQVKTAEANIQTAEAQVLQKQAVLRHAQVNLDHTYIRAPVDGTVILRNVDVGQTVAASLQAPVLFTIAQDLRAMQVHTSVDEADVGVIKDGQDVRFTVDAYPGRTFEGVVEQVRKAPQVVQNVVTYDVVVSAPNPDLLLFPGLTANVRIVTATRDQAIRLPNAALRYRPSQGVRAERPGLPGEGQVFVLDGEGKPRPVTLKLGISDGSVTEMLAGDLQEGRQVIVGEVTDAQGRGPAVPSSLTMGPRF